jgi:hypothetical protein
MTGGKTSEITKESKIMLKNKSVTKIQNIIRQKAKKKKLSRNIPNF